MNYYEALTLELELLEEEQRSLRKEIDEAYEGFLVCQKYGEKYYYYRKRKVGTRWIREKLAEEDMDLIADLVQKRENKKKLRKLTRRLKAAQAYIKTYDSCKVEDKKDSTGMDELHKQIFDPDPLDFREWGGAPYRGYSDYHPEELRHRTGKGNEKVRSKSEELIARALRAHGIEYHYEEELRVGNRTYHPDFTIRHPITGIIVIWEHHGLMDDREYVRKTAEKLRNYMVNGYTQMKNLITTFEDREHPLDLDEVNWIIERQLLEK